MNQVQMMQQVPAMNQLNQVAFNGGVNGVAGGGIGGYMWPPVNNAGYVHTGFNNKNNWNMNKRNNNNNKSNLGYNNNKHVVSKEMQQQNRLKPRRFVKKKFSYGSSKTAPLAPRNTTSFLIRAKKSGGIASLVSPCAVTPAVLPTPVFSPSREVLVDMAKEEWGVDGYGSMKGLIRLRTSGNEDNEDEEGEDAGSGEIDVEEHVEVERRLDQDLSRFEMVSVNNGGGNLEDRVDDQDSHIARLEEENMLLKERLFYIEREFGNLRTRLQSLEIRRQKEGDHGLIEEVVENESENDSGSGGHGRSVEGNNELAEDINNKNEETVTVDIEASKEDGDQETNDAKEKDLNGTVDNLDSSEVRSC